MCFTPAVRSGAEPFMTVKEFWWHKKVTTLPGGNIKRFSALRISEACTGILFLQSDLRLFLLSISQLAIFLGCTSTLYCKLSNNSVP